jgi:hypothetical protein
VKTAVNLDVCRLALLLVASMVGEVAAQPAPLYRNDFEQAETGKLPAELMILDGAFTVKADATNKFVELPGNPLDTFSLLFGPPEKDRVAVTARIVGEAKGRRTPAFGVGLNGAGAYRLQVSPGKKALELYKGDEVVASKPFSWQSGRWLNFRLAVAKPKESEWLVQGKAWPEAEREPEDWTVSFKETEEPRPGRAVVFGLPYAGTPLRFDDLTVTRFP